MLTATPLANSAAARSTLTRSKLKPLPASATNVLVTCMAAASSSTVAFGNPDLSSANAPATCGVAIDVPFQLWYPPPGMDDAIPLPGATKSIHDAALLKPDIASGIVVEPTVIAEEMQPGKFNPSE